MRPACEMTFGTMRPNLALARHAGFMRRAVDMPKLPNAGRAFIDGRKLSDCRLAQANPNGGAKARFFTGFGFKREAPDGLRAALLAHARSNEVLRLQTSPHGAKYVVEGPLPAPDGRSPSVRSVWIIDAGEDAPRFVTAFPGRRTRA